MSNLETEDWEDAISKAVYLFSYQVLDFPYVYENNSEWILRGAHSPCSFLMKIFSNVKNNSLHLDISCFSDVTLAEGDDFSYEFFTTSQIVLKGIPTRDEILVHLHKVFNKIKEMG